MRTSDQIQEALTSVIINQDIIELFRQIRIDLDSLEVESKFTINDIKLLSNKWDVAIMSINKLHKSNWINQEFMKEFMVWNLKSNSIRKGDDLSHTKYVLKSTLHWDMDKILSSVHSNAYNELISKLESIKDNE